jgi:predicted SAM-dependent methyltransferase
MNVNIACGDSYLESWTNFDYSPHSQHVTKANLLNRLPLEDNQASCVYSSHFLEHIPRHLVSDFLSECYRIMSQNGKIRLVLPDFEELCKTYLENRQNNNHEKADFLILEIIDQYARSFSGGELGKYYHSIASSNNMEMIDYINQRTGHLLTSNPQLISKQNKFKDFINNPNKILNKLESIYCKLLIRLLPNAFRQQNVSLTTVGEKHMWAYDFHTVEQLLLNAGSQQVKRMSANTSEIADFPFYPLDLTEKGLPRKGAESMYIEATKL